MGPGIRCEFEHVHLMSKVQVLPNLVRRLHVIAIFAHVTLFFTLDHTSLLPRVQSLFLSLQSLFAQAVDAHIPRGVQTMLLFKIMVVFFPAKKQKKSVGPKEPRSSRSGNCDLFHAQLLQVGMSSHTMQKFDFISCLLFSSLVLATIDGAKSAFLCLSTWVATRTIGVIQCWCTQRLLLASPRSMRIWWPWYPLGLHSPRIIFHAPLFFVRL